MTKNGKKQYKYDFTEQRELSEGLRKGDKQVIANKTGYKLSTVVLMCQGKRTMADSVRKMVNHLVLVNKQIEQIQVEQREITK